MFCLLALDDLALDDVYCLEVTDFGFDESELWQFLGTL